MNEYLSAFASLALIRGYGDRIGIRSGPSTSKSEGGVYFEVSLNSSYHGKRSHSNVLTYSTKVDMLRRKKSLSVTYLRVAATLAIAWPQKKMSHLNS